MSGAFDPERHMDLMAPLLGLSIPEGQRESVAGFLRIAHAMAALVQAAPLEGDTLDLAPVFTPAGPDAA